MSKKYEADETLLFDSIDKTLANMDLLVLEKARQECIKNNESTEIIDKAIKEKHSRNRIELLDDMSNLSSKKENNNDILDINRYEEYNMEEEELEEDDFHYEDLD